MKIVNHRLCHQDGTPYPFAASPNKGGKMQPQYLIMHFTAGRGFDSAVSWLSNPQAKASAHLVIGRDGQMTQLVPFNIVAWHAGASAWQGLTGLNSASLGIELDNAGRLKREGGRWRVWFKEVYPDDDVLEAVHKHDPLGDAPSGWHIYTPS
jgi:N-acetylmuramoyl-L-alanine amidase